MIFRRVEHGAPYLVLLRKFVFNCLALLNVLFVFFLILGFLSKSEFTSAFPGLSTLALRVLGRLNRWCSTGSACVAALLELFG